MVAVDIKANGGLVIDSTEVTVDLSASAITGTLDAPDGGTGLTAITENGIMYGKGVNETAGTISQSGAVITLDLATGTFFSHTFLTTAPTSWKILHLPALNTVAAWVVKITNFSTARTNTWVADTGPETSTYDNAGTWTICTPVFHWAGGTDHVMTATNNAIDIVSFWTLGGDNPVIYSTVSGQAFAT